MQNQIQNFERTIYANYVITLSQKYVGLGDQEKLQVVCELLVTVRKYIMKFLKINFSI